MYFHLFEGRNSDLKEKIKEKKSDIQQKPRLERRREKRHLTHKLLARKPCQLRLRYLLASPTREILANGSTYLAYRAYQ